jgi:type III pantothenate kinase
MEIVSDISLIEKDIIEKFAAVDIGNSRLKLLYSNTFESFAYNSDFNISIENYLSNLPNINLTFAISSVNSIITNEFIKILSNHQNFQSLPIQVYLEKQNLVDFSSVSGIGEDRKLGIIGGLLYAKPPFATIDIGTATTINVIDKDKTFRGGVIFPGPFTQMKSLNDSTAALKDFKIEQSRSIIATNTADAINSGIINGSVGSILFFIDYLRENIINQENFPIFITGGSSFLIRDILEKYCSNIQYKPYLVPLGIMKMMTAANNKFF